MEIVIDEIGEAGLVAGVEHEIAIAPREARLEPPQAPARIDADLAAQAVLQQQIGAERPQPVLQRERRKLRIELHAEGVEHARPRALRAGRARFRHSASRAWARSHATGGQTISMGSTRALRRAAASRMRSRPGSS
jgi:hypothetical protein